MEFLRKIQILERVDQLIRLKSTGTPDDLSILLNVSKRSVYNIIELMKNMGAPIKYCQMRKTYYYSYQCNLIIGFVNSKKILVNKGEIS